MTDLEAQVRWLLAWAPGQGALGEWSLLYNLEIALLMLACAAPLEDGRWTRLAFDVECRLGELEAEDPTLAERGLVLGVDPAALSTCAVGLRGHAETCIASVPFIVTIYISHR